MPEYEHICENEKCQHAWNDTYSIKADPPKICPKCNMETAKRLISGGGHGKMILNDDEWKASLKDETRKLEKDIYSDSKKYANFIGEDRYHSIQSQMDKNRKR